MLPSCPPEPPLSAVLNAALPIFALILAGFLCARRGLLGAGATDSLNRFVVWLALPALLFQAMAQITRAEIDHPAFLAAYGGAMAATFGCSFALDRRRNHRLADRAIEGLDAAYANTGFMGIPLCLAALGTASLPPAIIATLLTACVLFAAAIVLIEADLQRPDARHPDPAHPAGVAAPRPGLLPVLRKVAGSLARNPLLAAPVLGLAFAATGAGLPAPLLRFTTLLGAAASPCALVTIGLFLAESGAGSRTPATAQSGPARPDPATDTPTHRAATRGTVARLVALKLLLQPALTAFLAFVVFPMPAAWSHAALLLSALPIGTGPFMLAKLYDREAAVTSRAILLSTVLSVATISALVARLG